MLSERPLDTPETFVLVYGALRSGTTLLRLMLDSHPDMECRGEADFLFEHLSNGDGGKWALDHDQLDADRIYGSSPARADQSVPAEEAVVGMARQLRSGQGHIVVLMIHRNLGRALNLFPDAQVIHMLRDPRDVARSSIGMGWAGTVYHGVSHWLGTEQEWSELDGELKARQITTLRYEDLILDPVGELSRICGALGTSYRAEMIEYDGSSTYSAPDPSLIAQWKRNLSAREVSLVEARCGSLLTDRGYLPSGHDPVHPGRIERTQLGLANKTYVWRHRIGRYGLIDPVMVAVSRRLRLPTLGRSAQKRIDEKVVKYLK